MPDESTVQEKPESNQQNNEPEVHTAREADLEKRVNELEAKLTELTTLNQQLYIKATGASETPSKDPVAETDKFLRNFVASHFDRNFLRSEGV